MVSTTSPDTMRAVAGTCRAAARSRKSSSTACPRCRAPSEGSVITCRPRSAPPSRLAISAACSTARHPLGAPVSVTSISWNRRSSPASCTRSVRHAPGRGPLLSCRGTSQPTARPTVRRMTCAGDRPYCLTKSLAISHGARGRPSSRDTA